MDSLEDNPRTFKDNAKITVFHLILLTDMCLFVSATLNAHLHFLSTWDSKCGNSSENSSLRTWSTVGYSLRLLFTLVFFLSKVRTLYFFLSSKEKFPKIGAYYSPLMSTLLLIVIVYDFSSCRQLSDIFSIRSAQRLVSWYTILVFAFLSGLIVLQLYIWATNRNKKNKAIVALKVIIGILYVIGCLVGVLANFEMLKKGKITYFAAFDLYSFVICGIMTAATAVKRCKSLRNPDAAIASL